MSMNECVCVRSCVRVLTWCKIIIIAFVTTITFITFFFTDRQ